MTTEEKIFKVLELSLKIPRSTFSHNSDCKKVSVYVVSEDFNKMLLDLDGYYGSTNCELMMPIDLMIDKMEEGIRQMEYLLQLKEQ